MKFGLSEKTCSTVCRILDGHPHVETAVLYGSRAKGTYRDGSDIDLTLMGEGLDQKTLLAIAWELDDSSIPYTVDLSRFEKIDSASLREHIRRVGVVFYEREGLVSQAPTACHEPGPGRA